MKQKPKVIQIGIGHDHDFSVINTMRKNKDYFDFMGYVVLEEEERLFERKKDIYGWAKRLKLEEALEIKGLQGAFIETDDCNLTEYAYIAAKKGLSIHMDKPGGQDAEKFNNLIDYCKQNDIIFHVAYMYRYNPAVKNIIERIRKNEFGKIYYIEAQMNFKEFNINDEVAIPFENGEIVLSPPILKWRIDDNDWNIQETESALWCREITNSSILYVDLPKSMSCIVALDNYIIEESGKKLEYKLGQTLYSLKNNNQFLKDFLSLFIKINDDKLFFLAKIYIRDSFIEEPLYIFSNINQLHWLPENYIGDKDSKFRLDIIQNSNILFSKELSTTKEIFTLTKAEDGYYKYRITLLSKGFLSKERELVCKDFILGNEKELKYKNKILSIRQVVLFDKIDSEVIRPVYIGSIRYLGNKDSFDYYSGSLFILNKEKKRVYLNKMINERNEIVRINPVRIEIKSENSCYLGYGLDTNDAEFEFDDEFTLDFQRKITICQQVLGEKTRNIDYFLFEVLNDV